MSNSDSEDADFESADEDFTENETNIQTKKDINKCDPELETKKECIDIIENSAATENISQFKSDEKQVISLSTVDDHAESNGNKDLSNLKVTQTNCNQNVDKPSCQNESQSSYWSSGSWGSWGQSLISTSWSNSISTLATHLGEGLNTVVETVEHSLDVPSPESMAEESSKRNLNSPSQDNCENNTKSPVELDSNNESSTAASSESYSSWFGGWGVSGFASGLSSTVQKTGTSLVYGGIDVLETIGKKTMDVLQETDPGLTRTKALLRPGSNKPNLSQILKEARSQENNNPHSSFSGDSSDNQDCHFGALLESEQALVHLEALEMLSKSCDTRLENRLANMSTSVISLYKQRLSKLQEVLESVLIDEERPSLPVLSEEEMNRKIEECWLQTNLGVQERLGQCRLKYRQLTCEAKESTSANVLNRLCMQNLAYLTARLIESFHKAGEIMVAKSKSISDWHDLSVNLVELVRLNCADNETMCSEYIALLKKLLNDANRQEINKCIANIYLEQGNSRSYIEDSFQLLIPVIKLANIESE